MGIETKVICDACGKVTGESGTGSSGEWINCNIQTPSGAVHLLGGAKTRWAFCASCFGKMRRLLKEHENPDVECWTCREKLARDSARIFYMHGGKCVRDSGLDLSLGVTVG